MTCGQSYRLQTCFNEWDFNEEYKQVTGSLFLLCSFLLSFSCALSLSLRTIFIDHYQRRTPCWKIGHAVEVLQQQRGLCEQTHVSWSSSATQRSCTAHARNTVRLLDVILIFIMTFREYDCGVQLWRDNVNCVHRIPVNTDNVVYHLYSTTLLWLTVLSSNFLSSVLFSSSKRPAGCHRKTAVSTFVFVFII